MIRNALSIAGSDPSGGAGIQADLKTFSARGVYGMAALTALTAQNTRGVSGVHLVPAAFVAAQIRAVFEDVRVDAVKIGMIATVEIAEAVADALRDVDAPIVLDPVMVAKGGAPLLADDAVDAVATRLAPLATVITPNLLEAERLLPDAAARTRAAMPAAAEALRARGARAVLLKGGHLGGAESPDVLVDAAGTHWLEGARTETRNTHGTGCTLSAALAAELAKGATLADAARAAKAYVSGAVAAADQLSVGAGHGPTHHFHTLWPRD